MSHGLNDHIVKPCVICGVEVQIKIGWEKSRFGRLPLCSDKCKIRHRINSAIMEREERRKIKKKRGIKNRRKR